MTADAMGRMALVSLSAWMSCFWALSPAMGVEPLHAAADGASDQPVKAATMRFGNDPLTLTVDPNYVPCWRARGALRLGLKELTWADIEVVDNWSPVLGNDVPLSDAQLAWLSDNPLLAKRFTEELTARGGKVFTGLLVTGIGIGGSMIGWTLFGVGKVKPTVTLPISIGGLAVAAVAILYTTWVLQQPLQAFRTPTPRHRLTRKEAYDLVTTFNRYQDLLLCREHTVKLQSSGRDAKTTTVEPVAAASAPADETGPIVIWVDAAQHVAIEGKTYSLDTLRAYLEPLSTRAKPPEIVIRLMPKVEPGLLVSVVDVVRSLEFKRIAIEELEPAR